MLEGKELEASEKQEDSTGDKYEDFPEDQQEDLTPTSALKIATEIKEIGNKLFKAGDIELGLEKYQKGLRYVNEFKTPVDDAPEELNKMLDSLRFSLHSNSSLLQLKQKQYDDAEQSATYALDIEGTTDAEKGKAYFRRAQARIALKAEDRAYDDLVQAANCAPNDGAVKKELEAIKVKRAERAKKEKAAYSKMFG